MRTSRGDISGAIAVGVLAATSAAIAHEALGHGAGCYVAGGQVSLLTSIFFHCDGATPLTDAAGPLGSLVAAIGSAALLRLTRHGAWLQVFGYLAFIINAGWFSGQLIYSAALDRDDWHYVARGLQWPESWRVFAVAAGVCVYWGSLRYARGWTLDRVTFRTGYAAAVTSAALAGLCWSRSPLASAWEGILAVGVAPLGLLFSGLRRSQQQASSVCRRPAWAWVGASAALYILFLVFEARGLGRLA